MGNENCSFLRFGMATPRGSGSGLQGHTGHQRQPAAYPQQQVFVLHWQAITNADEAQEMNHRISRRTVLRGAGSVIALPLLEAMTPRIATAAQRARNGGPPARMVVCHYGTGTNVDEFFPTDTGRDFTFSRILKPLETFREQMTVMSGTYLEHGDAVMEPQWNSSRRRK